MLYATLDGDAQFKTLMRRSSPITNPSFCPQQAVKTQEAISDPDVQQERRGLPEGRGHVPALQVTCF